MHLANVSCLYCAYILCVERNDIVCYTNKCGLMMSACESHCNQYFTAKHSLLFYNNTIWWLKLVNYRSLCLWWSCSWHSFFSYKHINKQINNNTTTVRHDFNTCTFVNTIDWYVPNRCPTRATCAINLSAQFVTQLRSVLSNCLEVKWNQQDGMRWVYIIVFNSCDECIILIRWRYIGKVLIMFQWCW